MEYTLSKINRLGDPDPTYGQTWYGEVHEDLKPVMFNVLEGEFEAGDKIEYEVSENKRSKKGVDYLRLKKVKKVGSMLAQDPVENVKKVFPGAQAEGFTAEDRAQLQRIEDTLNSVMERLAGL